MILRVELELLSVALFIMAEDINDCVLPIDAMKFRVKHEHPQEPIFLLFMGNKVFVWKFWGLSYVHTLSWTEYI